MSENNQTTENPLLEVPNKDTELKKMLVEYTGTKLDSEEVTVQMIAEVLATDFPEFAFAFAEENFIRGYELGLNDAEILARSTQTNIRTSE